MRLPSSAHTSRPWRIHELTHDFRLEDVWALPTPGGAGDLPRFVEDRRGRPDARLLPRRPHAVGAAPETRRAVRLGRPGAGVGSRVQTLRDRLPADLREARPGPDFDALPFTSLYLTDDEWAAEIANLTMHGVMHIGWVKDETGAYRGQMAVLVKPNGLLGTAYMAAIRPFRHLIVYPRLIGQIERQWQAPRGARTTGEQPNDELRRSD